VSTDSPVSSTAVGSRVGIFGGTFDPPHIAHLVVAAEVRDALSLDIVHFVVAGEPWQKVGTRLISSAKDRLDMVSAVLAGGDKMEPSDLEMQRDGSSYTIDTLREFYEAAPEDELFLILGADAASGLASWESADGIEDLCKIVVVDRPGEHVGIPEQYSAIRVEAPSLDLSSTDLRERVQLGKSIKFLVPDAAISIVESRGLYSDGL